MKPVYYSPSIVFSLRPCLNLQLTDRTIARFPRHHEMRYRASFAIPLATAVAIIQLQTQICIVRRSIAFMTLSNSKFCWRSVTTFLCKTWGNVRGRFPKSNRYPSCLNLQTADISSYKSSMGKQWQIYIRQGRVAKSQEHFNGYQHLIINMGLKAFRTSQQKTSNMLEKNTKKIRIRVQDHCYRGKEKLFEKVFILINLIWRDKKKLKPRVDLA